MTEFTRVNGTFTTRFPDGKSGAKLEDKFKFKRAGWTWNRKTKGWVTGNTEKARLLAKFAVGAAKEHLEGAELVRQAMVDASWAEDTDKDFPAPDGLAYMPFQKAGIEYAINRDNTGIFDPPGLGKSLISNEKIHTIDGLKEISILTEKDFVFSSDGKIYPVTGVFPQGLTRTFQVTFSDGTKIKCSPDHLWTVHNKWWGKNKIRTLTTQKIVDLGLFYEKSRPKFSLPLLRPINHTQKAFEIPPYTMGYLLGDGSVCNGSIKFTTSLKEENCIFRISQETPDHLEVTTRKSKKRAIECGISKKRKTSKTNSYMRVIRQYELDKQKYIPEIYLQGSIEQRLDLLQGLMDSDGWVEKDGCSYFGNTNEDLIDGVVDLVRSLGGVTQKRPKKVKEGCKPFWNVHVSIGDMCPVSASEKVIRWHPKNTKVQRKRFIVDIEDTKEWVEQTCISVSSPDNTFITKDYVVTHNTIQAIGVHNCLNTQNTLIIVPASLKVNWEREWLKWDVHGRSVGIAHSKTCREPIFDEDGVRMRDHNNKPMTRTWTEHVWPDTDVVVVNYDMLESFDDQVKEREWDLMICDEAHLLKNKDALRSLCVFGGWRKGVRKNGIQIRKPKTFAPIVAKKTLFLTGTPILSKPVELWTIIRACDPKGLGTSWDDFVFTYCGAYYDGNHLDTSGATNLEELSRLLRERFMVRRDKRTVLKELPDKTRELIMLPQDKLEAPVKKEQTRLEKALSAYEDLVGISDVDRQFRYIKAIDDLTDKLQNALDQQSGEEPNWDAAVKTLDEPDQILFTEISLAREEVALAKVGMVVDHVNKLVESEESVICFAYHKSVVTEIKDRLEKLGLRVGVVTGSVPSKKRQAVVDAFQEGEFDVIIGNIMAMGVGFTLTRARFVVFAELDWVPALIEQAEDRAWRHGQLNAVLIQHLVVDGSIESRMAVALLEKMGVIAETLDSR